MKKMLKEGGIAVFAALALCALVLAGCSDPTGAVNDPLGESKTALAAPDVRIDAADFTLKWDAVTGASSYSVVIDNVPETVTGTEYALAHLADDMGVYQIKVKALAGSSETYEDSAYSDTIDCEPAVYVFTYDSVPAAQSVAARAAGNAVTITGLTNFGKLLSTLNIPRTITSLVVEIIGNNAFKDNDVITSVVIPETVIEVGDNAFSGCTELMYVAFERSAEDGITILGEGVFDGCTAIENIFVPEGSEDDYIAAIVESTPEMSGVLEEIVQGQSKTLVSIAIIAVPAKLAYEVGEEFDPTGMVVQATYDDESSEAVTGYTIRLETAAGEIVANGPLAVNHHKVIISYFEGGITKMADIAIIVTDPNSGPETVPVASVSLNETSLSLTVGGDTAALIPTVLPANATNKAVNWSSDTPAVATVTNGVVTPVSQGTAKITVTTVDGNKTAECTVTVNPPVVSVGSVSLDATLKMALGGGTVPLIPVFTPDNATNKAVSWQSDNTAVATVTNGVVNAVAIGTAVITVTTTDGNKTASCVVEVVPSLTASGTAPANVKAYYYYDSYYPNNVRIRLTWESNEEISTTYNAIYRADSEAGPYVQIGKRNPPGTFTFTDSTLSSNSKPFVFGPTYYYRVAIIDNDTNEVLSPLSAPVAFTAEAKPLTLDTPVLGDFPAYGAEWYALNVTAGTTYYFWTEGTSGSLAPSAYHSVTEEFPYPNLEFDYTEKKGTYAAETSGTLYVKVSSSSATSYNLVCRTTDSKPLLPPAGITVDYYKLTDSVSSNKAPWLVRLQWYAELEVDSSDLYRSTDGVNYTFLRNIPNPGGMSDRSNFNFTDSPLEGGTTYYYKVKVKKGSEESELSGASMVTTVPITTLTKDQWTTRQISPAGPAGRYHWFYLPWGSPGALDHVLWVDDSVSYSPENWAVKYSAYNENGQFFRPNPSNIANPTPLSNELALSDSSYKTVWWASREGGNNGIYIIVFADESPVTSTDSRLFYIAYKDYSSEGTPKPAK